MNKTFKVWVSLCSYHVLMRQNCKELQESLIRSAFKSEIRPLLHLRQLFCFHIKRKLKKAKARSQDAVFLCPSGPFQQSTKGIKNTSMLGSQIRTSHYSSISAILAYSSSRLPVTSISASSFFSFIEHLLVVYGHA